MNLEILILLITFIAMVIFVLVGVNLFSKGWTSYEEKYVQGAEKTLDAMYISLPPQHILYIGLALLVFFGGLTALATGHIFVGVTVGVITFFIPQVAIVIMKRQRDVKFGIQLIDALSTMSNGLKAGLSLQQSFDVIHNEMDNPIKQEFRLLTQEMKFGLTTNEAMSNLQDRMPNPDLALLSTAIGVSQDVGGNLSEIFDNISNTIRERQRVEQRVKALTSQGKMQGVILCLVPIGLFAFLSVVYPDMMSPMVTTPIGWGLIVVAILLLMLGGFFIMRIVDITL